MARGKVELLERERESADDAEIIGPISTDPDSEQSWDEWIDALKNADTAGVIRAHRLPVDADGNPMLGKGSRQIYLGSWPHQLYTFDDLLAKLTKEFLKPGETAHVKLTGTAPGHRGVMFSRIVTLQKADGPVDPASNNGETIGQLFKVLQESQDRQLATLRDLMAPNPAPAAPGRGGMEIVKDIAAIMAPILGPAIAAYIARPALPKSDMGELLNVMVQMKEFVSGTSPSESEDSTTLGIIKAVAPALPQLLQILSHQPAAPPVVARPRLPRPPMPTVDLSKPSSIPQSSNAPTTEVDPVLAQLKPQLDQLAQLAEQNADPIEVAKLTLQMIPPDFQDKLAEIVADPAGFARMAVLSPELKKHSTWFESLRKALEDELFEKEEQPSQST